MVYSKCLTLTHHSVFQQCDSFIHNDNTNDCHKRLVHSIRHNCQTDLLLTSRLLRNYIIRKHIRSLYRIIPHPNKHPTQALYTFINQQYDHILYYVPQLFQDESAPTQYHTLRISVCYVKQTYHTNTTHTLKVRSLSENHIRYALGNTLHQPTDALRLHIYERDLWVQCIVQPDELRIPLHVVFINTDGQLLQRTSMNLLPTVPLIDTLFAIVHNSCVRRWLYTTTTKYPYITLFLHSQLVTARSLAHHGHLQPNDTLCCIMTTATQKQQMHTHIHDWVTKLHAQGQATLRHMHITRQQLHKEVCQVIPYTTAFRLSAFHSHVWMLWVQQLGLLYTIDKLRRNKILDKWLNFHCTLLANSLWNDYAYHTNQVFDDCATQCMLYETDKWKYIMEHWDVLSMSWCVSPKEQCRSHLLYKMQREYAKASAKTKEYRTRKAST